MGTALQRTRAIVLVSLGLFALNAWIVHGLFTAAEPFTTSNEAAFISISRFFFNHWRDGRWFPWFDGGMPIENAYQPLLPVFTALLSAASGCSLTRAFHVLLAVAYCLGPVTFFWLVSEWSAQIELGAFAALLYSLISPAAILIPGIHPPPPGAWSALRLFDLVYYGEGPHNLSLTLLPVALLLLRRAILYPSRWNRTAAVLSCAAIALTNVLGAFGLALAALFMALVLERGLVTVILVGLAAWMLASPWLPPSLLATLRSNAILTGLYERGLADSLATAALVAITAILWWVTRGLESFSRFSCLFAVWMCAIPLLDIQAGIRIVPLGHRYQLEFEMALCLLAASLLALPFFSRSTVRAPFAAILLLISLHQGLAYRQFAIDVLRPLPDVTSRVEYKAAQWIDHNLPGQRVMLSGGAAYLFNMYSDNPQFSGGHEPQAPNFMQQVAVYTVYTGMNAGARDPGVSILWLKAFGNQAFTVPGKDSSEFFKPFVNPNKFEGVLPALWRAGGDTIYAIPQRSPSLAHVIPAAAIVTLSPAHGLDTAPFEPYVAALDDPAMPLADLRWTSSTHAEVLTTMRPGQVLSIQENYHPAWHAWSQGVPVPIHKDGLGMLVIDAGCNGACAISLDYGTTPEIWFCRIASTLVALSILAALGHGVLKYR